jgi:hypothetical protein
MVFGEKLDGQVVSSLLRVAFRRLPFEGNWERARTRRGSVAIPGSRRLSSDLPIFGKRRDGMPDHDAAILHFFVVTLCPAEWRDGFQFDGRRGYDYE